MAGKKRPAFPFYAFDWFTDRRVRRLTREKRATLIDLWCLQFMDGDPIPDDPEWIAGECRAPVEDVVELLEDFFERRGDAWVSPRLEAEIEEMNNRAQAARENGSKGGRPKKNRRNQPPTGSPKTQPETQTETRSETQKEPRSEPAEKLPSPSPSPSPSSVPTPSHPSSHPTRTADVRPPTVEDGWLAGREVVPPEEDPPPESAASAATGRIINLARRRAGPSRPVPVGRAVGDVVAGIARRQAGGAS